MNATDFYGVEELAGQLRLDEGERTGPYLDTASKMTIGVGRNLTDVGISGDEMALMLSNDIARAAAGLAAIAPWWTSLPPAQARVMLNLAFNMGARKLALFPVFLAAMQRGDWNAAAAALTDSLWFRQVGARGPRMVARLNGWAV